MREIKFRGRRSYDKKWIYGSLLVDNSGDFHILESDVVEKDGHHIYIDSDSPMFFDNDTVGQFTGLHDDSDDEKEVYENDIALVNYGTNKIKAIVKFERGAFILVSNEFTDGYIPLFEVSESDREYEWINGIVIGNIHEKEK